MKSELKIFNTLSRKKEIFTPIKPPHVGLYVCGPTVYGDPHLGHARPAITFDILFRYLSTLGYKVRYVRNITDVGHLENDADEGEDKVAQKARLEELEPMEVVQYYTERYHTFMNALHVKSPSIEPRASGHIIEQLAIVEKILKEGFAYESNGSVYFDVERYNQEHQYGTLSGRVLEDLLSTTRQLEGQTEKKNSYDFALWKKATPSHIMRWPSRFSDGFPGWHLECTAMSARYLGETFDIHGGGMDLLFPHHECEIAQSTIAHGHGPARYWMHNNMITINGQKMGKSLGNFITLEEFFTGNHALIEKAYGPMTIRFFILQAHYRSTVDFSNDALMAAEKGLLRLMDGMAQLAKIKAGTSTTFDVEAFKNKCFEALNDDLNTPILIAHLFDAVRIINQSVSGQAHFTEKDLTSFTELLHLLVFDILGLAPPENSGSKSSETLDGVMHLVLDMRQQAKANKDWGTADQIRDALSALGIVVKDSKEGATWEIK
ncbi:cysteine--tRNA ligase [Geofilum rubicundum]|uniref:Cysteine--tRNA ligase n=1 Tax=Geofilum rubicundum JCM 15548 TaxID=1236989 RepID=A0A0E9LZP6_9BACT|nr:cysteine--tRNA ligase [Geofilum rubicundum]GAO30596.1 cysteinyl-tRNA synthetase [Geofilum rubicundum JCM 15548]